MGPREAVYMKEIGLIILVYWWSQWEEIYGARFPDDVECLVDFIRVGDGGQSEN